MTAFYSNGKPRGDGFAPPKRKFKLGETVRIVHLMPKTEFAGVVTCEKPLVAKVTDNDPVWFGCEVKASNIKRAKVCFGS